MFLKMVGEIIKEMARSLFKTIQGLLEAKDIFSSTDVVVLKTARLVNVDLFFERQGGMNEGSSDVGLR